MRWDPGPRASRPVKRGNWWCNSCNASNVAPRQTCYRCTSKRTPKTMSEFWRCKSCDHPNRRTHFDCGNCGELHSFIAAVQKKLSPGNRNIYEISKVVLSAPVAAALHDAMVAQGAVPSELDSSALYTLANLTENMALDVLAHMGAMPTDSLSNPGGFIIAVANYYNSPNLTPGFQPMQPMDAAGQQQVKAFVAQCEALRLLPQAAIDDPMLRLLARCTLDVALSVLREAATGGRTEQRDYVLTVVTGALSGNEKHYKPENLLRPPLPFEYSLGGGEAEGAAKAREDESTASVTVTASASEAETAMDLPPNCILVTQIPPDASEGALRRYFETFGSVVRAEADEASGGVVLEFTDALVAETVLSEYHIFQGVMLACSGSATAAPHSGSTVPTARIETRIVQIHHEEASALKEHLLRVSAETETEISSQRLETKRGDSGSSLQRGLVVRGEPAAVERAVASIAELRARAHVEERRQHRRRRYVEEEKPLDGAGDEKASVAKEHTALLESGSSMVRNILGRRISVEKIYPEAFNAFYSAGRRGDARDIVVAARKREEASVALYTAAMSSAAKAVDIETAEIVWAEAAAVGTGNGTGAHDSPSGLVPLDLPHTTIRSDYLQTLVSAKELERAAEELEAMISIGDTSARKPSPLAITNAFYMLMQETLNMNLPDAAVNLTTAAVEANVQPDVGLFQIAAKAAIRARNVGPLEQLAAQLDEGKGLSALMYNEIIEANISVGDVSRALDWLRKMGGEDEHTARPSRHTFRILKSNFLRLGLEDKIPQLEMVFVQMGLGDAVNSENALDRDQN